MNVTLTKLDSTHTNLRTETVVGEAALLPEVGHPFFMTSESLTDKEAVRYIRTTPVVLVNQNNGVIEFSTLNSNYSLTVHPRPEFTIHKA